MVRSKTGSRRDRQSLRVGLFTDTLDEINGVGRFIRDMGEQAHARNRHFTIHTCCNKPVFALPNRKNFEPLLSRKFPFYPELELNLPPVSQILEWADRQKFDAVHVSTPGVMGLCGVLVSRMLRIPLLGTYHTDFPAYVDNLIGEKIVTSGTTVYMRWFYARLCTVFSRSRDYQDSLRALGVTDDRLAMTVPGINTTKFNASHRDPAVWDRHRVTQPKRILYCGRISLEKNLRVLATAFRSLCEKRNDTALVLAGDGPYRQAMTEELRGLPAYFLGYQTDGPLASLYASADLFAFPSHTDTLGQVVMEAQASGLPALVSDQGGPKEVIDDGVTGRVLDAHDADAWADALHGLLEDDAKRQSMAQAAPACIDHYSLENTFESFWRQHLIAARGPVTEPSNSSPTIESAAVAS